jgi:hypothetical protein
LNASVSSTSRDTGFERHLAVFAAFEKGLRAQRFCENVTLWGGFYRYSTNGVGRRLDTPL